MGLTVAFAFDLGFWLLFAALLIDLKPFVEGVIESFGQVFSEYTFVLWITGGISYSTRASSSIYASKSSDTAITAMPAIRPPIAKWCSPYSSAVGNNSSSEM